MRQSVPRIRSVKMKDGGAQIYVVPRKMREHHKEVCYEMTDAVTGILQQNGDLAGFCMVAWDSRGGSASVYYLSDESPISSDMLAVHVHDVTQMTVMNARTRSMLED